MIGSDPTKTQLHFGENLSNEIEVLMSKPNTFAIIDCRVYQLYADFFNKTKRFVYYFTHEGNKSLELVQQICNFLLKNNADRHSTLVAIGGGIIGDMAGFASSIYMRGINCIQVPTTLLAQVDAGIGGKTGVNTKTDSGLIKNAIGRFHFPSDVYIYPQFLQTLDTTQFLCGIGEVIKTSALDKEVFEFFTENQKKIYNKNMVALDTIVKLCANFKNNIVKKDPFETTGLRKILNFGHTVGHAIEAQKDNQLSHGKCVLQGMKLEMDMLKEHIDKDFYNSFQKLIVKALGDKNISYNSQKLLNSARKDKKNVGGKISIMCATNVGKCKEFLLTEDEFLNRLNLCQQSQ